MRKILLTLALCGLGFTFACGDASGPRSGLNIISGDNLSDTVGSILKPALTVELLDGNLQPMSGQTIYFNTSSVLLVAPIDDPAFVINRLPVTTDASGQAAVWVEAKFAAGPGKVVIEAPSGQTTEAHYAVLPGAPALVRADPSDTALYVGGTVTYRPFVTDAYGDRLQVTPTYQYQTLNSVLSISSPGKATGTVIGRGSVAVTALGFADTVWASVVPKGRVAAQQEGVGDSGPGYIVLTNLDGSGFDTIPGSFTVNHSLDWSPVDATIVVNRSSSLVSVDMAGNSRYIVTDALIRAQLYPRYAHDGSNVYFSGIDSLTNCWGVWRIHPNGTGLEHVVADTSDCGQYVYQQPPSPDYASSPSPDGTRLVYVGRTLRVRTLTTGADTSLGVVGDVPRWSPTGEWIAYDSLGTLMMIHPDGTGHQSLFYRGDFAFLPAFTWSPDGQWLLYWGFDQPTRFAGLTLLQLATGLKLPLRFAAGLAEPTWQP